MSHQVIFLIKNIEIVLNLSSLKEKYQLSIGKSFEINQNQFHAKMHEVQVANIFELLL